MQIVGKTTNDQVFSGAEGIADLDSFAAAAGTAPQDPAKSAVDINQIPVYQDELDAYIESTFDMKVCYMNFLLSLIKAVLITTVQYSIKHLLFYA